MAIDRSMVGLPNSPSFRYKQLNPAYQSDPRRILGQSLMKQGNSYAPVQTPLQGLGRLSSALVGAYLQKGAMDRQVTREDERTKQIMGMIPENASPEMRAYAQSNPEGFMSAFGQSLMQPKLTSELVDLEGGYKGIKSTRTGPFNNESSTISNLTQDKIPTQTTAYKNARSIGLVPGTPEFNDFIKKSSATGTTVNVGNKAGYNELLQSSKKLNEASRNSAASNMQIDTMLGLLNDDTIKTGTGAGFINAITKVGQVVNPEFKLEGVTGVEAFKGFANQVILPKIKLMGSKPTDKDLEFVVNSYASLSNSVSGNKFLLEALSLSNARDVALAEVTNKFLDDNKDNLSSPDLPFKLQAHLTKFTETSPLYTEAASVLKERFKNITGKDASSATSNNQILNSFKSKGWIK